MKKRLLTTAISIYMVFAMGLTSFAAPQTATVSNDNSIVAFAGTATPGTYVSLTLLNPGKTEADMISSPASAVQFFGGKTAGNSQTCATCGLTGNWCFHVQIKDFAGSFTLIANADGVKDVSPFPFYPVAVKKQTIIDINDAAAVTASLVDEAMTNFSLTGFDLYAGGVDKTAVGTALGYLKTAAGGAFPYADDTDLSDFVDILKDACLIAAYNTDNANILEPGGTLIHLEDIMSLTGTDELADYENLSGKAYISADMFKKTYESISELEDAFKEAIRFRVLVSYKDLGYGHVAGYFAKYNAYYTSVGFNFVYLNSLSAKDDAYIAVSASEAADINALKEEFNLFVANYKSSSGSSSSSGGGGGYGGFGGSVSNNSAKDETQEPEVTVPDTPSVPSVPTVGGFSDVPETHWAADNIVKLVEAKILSGRGNDTFDTEGNITRAELIKIAVLGTMGEADKNAVNPFGDADNHWAKDFIATAVEKGITTGITADSFGPDGQITREQAATILYRAALAADVKLEIGTEKFEDDASISDWAKDAVYALKKAEILSGRGGNNFCGGELLTRAEAAKLLCAIMDIIDAE